MIFGSFINFGIDSEYRKTEINYLRRETFGTYFAYETDNEN
jgi:hypothetical protein